MSEIYAVWWRAAGEKNFGDGPMNWVRVDGNRIDTGILTLQVDNDLPEQR